MSVGTEHLTLSCGEKLSRIIPPESGKERPGKGKEGVLVCGASWNHQ